ncbi:type VI secretion system-associated FHA domain protein [Azospirillum lipoferum]|uniref:SMAD/FHA domain type VI secretion machinery component n=1 Tax=Azospirillum lipoferum (strain 4B) TaxID=862719 RepID=G7Z5W7_AZOL4|nr:FHA domain-containing protein [Azospirillum lipoferum]CBS86353.1 putative SMAD/FHA domain; type VI secretion machinery component [Azospirillum lipoferum 4B]
MKLRLTLIQCPPAQGGDIARDLGTGRLVIGRGPDCDWVLNDPERMLSKIHCMVEFKGGVYIVIDSSTNGVFLNDAPTPIGRGNSAVVGEGDRLRMGGFVMRAGFAAEEAPPANDPFLAVLRGSDEPAQSPAASPEDDPFALPAFGRGPMSVMPIPEDDDLFGDLPQPDTRWGGNSAGGWQPTAAGNASGGDPDWPGSTQTDFSPDSLGTIRVSTGQAGFGAAKFDAGFDAGFHKGNGGSSIPDDWLDDPVDLPPATQPSNPPANPPAIPPDDWADEPLVPPAFGARPSPFAAPSVNPVPADPAADALSRALVDVVLSLVRRQAALEAMLGLDPDDTMAQGDSILRRAVDADDALARLRALPLAEAEALLQAAVSDGAAHQSALLAAVRELTGETADGGTRLAALYRRLLPIHRHALGG